MFSVTKVFIVNDLVISWEKWESFIRVLHYSPRNNSTTHTKLEHIHKNRGTMNYRVHFCVPPKISELCVEGTILYYSKLSPPVVVDHANMSIFLGGGKKNSKPLGP
jgi:hypothetical protein